MPTLPEISEFLSAHGPWPFFVLILAGGLYLKHSDARQLRQRLADVHDRSTEQAVEVTRVLTDIAATLRERLPK